MNKSSTTVITGIVLSDEVTLTLEEFCQACGIDEQQVREMIAHGLLEPRGESPPQWRFSFIAVHRSQSALRLQRDLEINLAGAALVLDLMDEINALRRKLGLLTH